jgi:AcrR family transcriptional regulator
MHNAMDASYSGCPPHDVRTKRAVAALQHELFAHIRTERRTGFQFRLPMRFWKKSRDRRLLPATTEVIVVTICSPVKATFVTPKRPGPSPLSRPPPRGTRLPREEREKFILQEAVKFFAEVGFGGDTRELARRAHITHALLFRYFPNKEALVERVYREVYEGRWNPDWEKLIADRRIGLEERMVRFYTVYAETILTYEWVRLLMFAGLKGSDLNRDFFARVTDRIIRPICHEIRRFYGLPSASEIPLTETEIELVWSVNSRVFYFGVRKYIYAMDVPADLNPLIEAEVRTFFEGIGQTLKHMLVLPKKRTRGVKK